ncbi:DUF1304 domain-containing protein [Arthrobacter psychrolactophilus]|uniref:DUF1304 domain-containing protein n=1 Tax=Arthrobacter psychrolactophilus TaxID=92442 RepID=A0A2V5IUL7_9MICC|nr:DUF1304 domain-containing protein [Arthrobacter psychrolactophilus]PYI37854.1 DUF1304 domain-containing protein [Arthrobacter psychrolactophilus]
MVIIGLVFAGIAALIHVYIFFLESIAWTGERSRATFGLASKEEAELTKSLAFNQGFYNLFLALGVLAGIVVLAVASSPVATAVGATLVFVGAGSMAAAGVVLLLSSPSKAGAALKQLVPPLLGVLALALGLSL